MIFIVAMRLFLDQDQFLALMSQLHIVFALKFIVSSTFPQSISEDVHNFGTYWIHLRQNVPSNILSAWRRSQRASVRPPIMIINHTHKLTKGHLVDQGLIGCKADLCKEQINHITLTLGDILIVLNRVEEHAQYRCCFRITFIFGAIFLNWVVHNLHLYIELLLFNSMLRSRMEHDVTTAVLLEML